MRNCCAAGLALVVSGALGGGGALAQSLPNIVEPRPRDVKGDLVDLRFATFNVEDLRSEHLADAANEKAKRVAEVLRRIRPDVVLINEIQYDGAGESGGGGGKNAGLLIERFLSVAQGEGLAGLSYRAIMLPSNTGVPSGFDLDNNGSVVTKPGSREYGGDCLGYGEFPGQFAMALLVRSDLSILESEIRAFRSFKWKDMPGALLPPAEGQESAGEGGVGWYSAEELAALPLSSKSHWDVPVKLRNGAVLHVLCSHPTPPVFDGDEDRNGRRNHDEIRLLADYINGAAYIVDDAGKRGGLTEDALFVVMGDLNADPGRGDGRAKPMDLLLKNARVQAGVAPVSKTPMERLRPDATAKFRLRVDYVLPSQGLIVRDSGVWRGAGDSPGAKEDVAKEAFEDHPSDHFPVWVDVRVMGITKGP